MKNYWHYFAEVFSKTWPGAVVFILLALWNCVEHRQSLAMKFFSFLGEGFDMIAVSLVVGAGFYLLVVTLMYPVVKLGRIKE